MWTPSVEVGIFKFEIDVPAILFKFAIYPILGEISVNFLRVPTSDL